ERARHPTGQPRLTLVPIDRGSCPLEVALEVEVPAAETTWFSAGPSPGRGLSGPWPGPRAGAAPPAADARVPVAGPHAAGAAPGDGPLRPAVPGRSHPCKQGTRQNLTPSVQFAAYRRS